MVFIVFLIFPGVVMLGEVPSSLCFDVIVFMLFSRCRAQNGCWWLTTCLSIGLDYYVLFSIQVSLFVFIYLDCFWLCLVTGAGRDRLFRIFQHPPVAKHQKIEGGLFGEIFFEKSLTVPKKTERTL